MSWTVSIRSLSDQLDLDDADRGRIQRTLAFSLSRYSDCLESIHVGIDVVPFASGPEYRCELQGIITGARHIQITTRGRSLEESIARAATRAARSAERTLLEKQTLNQ